MPDAPVTPIRHIFYLHGFASSARSKKAAFFAERGMRPLGYSFYNDSLEYDAFAAMFRQPALIFQGLRDDAVDHRVVEKYASERPNVTVSLLEDGHQLIASLPRIWSDVEPFL